MSHQLHRLTLSKTVKKQGEDLKNNEGEWTGKEEMLCERECKMLKLEPYTRRTHTHTHPLSHIFTIFLRLSLTHAHTHKENARLLTVQGRPLLSVFSSCTWAPVCWTLSPGCQHPHSELSQTQGVGLCWFCAEVKESTSSFPPSFSPDLSISVQLSPYN